MHTACDVSLPQDSDRAHYWLVTLGPSELNWATLPSPLLCPPSLPCSGSRLASWRSPPDRRRRQTKPSIRCLQSTARLAVSAYVKTTDRDRDWLGCRAEADILDQLEEEAGGAGGPQTSTGCGINTPAISLSLSLSLYWWVIRLIGISSLSLM